MAVPEAPLEQTEHGLVCTGPGWFVVKTEEVRWRAWEGLGVATNYGGDTRFEQLGIGITVLGPGEPMSMYHWEGEQEDFLVLAGSGTLVIDGEERPLRQWDFVHCPPHTSHVIVGGPCTVLSVGSRTTDDGEYVADAVAARHGASSPVTTADSDVAYARFPPREFTRYGGWLA